MSRPNLTTILVEDYHKFIRQTAVANLHNAVFNLLQSHDEGVDLIHTASVDTTEVDAWYRTAFSQLHHIGLSVEEIADIHTEIVCTYLTSAYDHLTTGELASIYHGFRDATATYRADLSKCQPLVWEEV